MSDPLLESLSAAVAASPDDTELRVLYAERLSQADRRDDAIGQAMVALAQSPEHARAQALLDELTAEGAAGDPDTEADDQPAEGDRPVYTTESPKPTLYQPHGQGDSGPDHPGRAEYERQQEERRRERQRRVKSDPVDPIVLQ